MLKRIITIAFLNLVVICKYLHATPGIAMLKDYRFVQNGPTRVFLAKDFYLPKPEMKTFKTNAYKLIAYARNFSQGETIYIELHPNIGTNFIGLPSIYLNESLLHVTKKKWGYKALVGVSTEAKNGVHEFKVRLKTEANLTHPAIDSQFYHKFEISKTDFPVNYEKIKITGSDTLKPKAIQSQLFKQIKFFKKIKTAALSHFTPNLYLSSNLAHPRDYHYITSSFWSTRHVQRYKLKDGKMMQLEPLVRHHGGLDLRARLGESIYSMAEGKVVISRQMYYEGNFILIDHGQGIFTGYMHLSKRLVNEGRYIKAGDILGKSGSTGMVTGAHLHIFLIINKVLVDPLSLLSLPIRD